MMRRRYASRFAAGAAILAGALLSANVTQAVEVDISGLTPELERNVRAYLSINDPALVEERRIRQLHAAARDEIASALRPFGYYEPSVEAELVQIERGWAARYAVDPGQPILLKVVDIEIVGEGQDAPSVAAARAAIRIAPGQILNHVQYQNSREDLYDAAYNAGFIDAAYQRSEILVRSAERTAEIHLHLDTGPLYYFGEIDVDQSVLEPEFMDRFITIEKDEPFNSDRLLALQIALNDSGYFENVTIDVARERTENQHIPIVVSTSPRRRREYTVGVGYGTDTGPRIRFGLNLRRIGAHGHRFSTDFRVSSIEQTAATEYRIPRRNVATDYLSFRSSLGHEEIGDWDTRKLMVGTAWHDDWLGLRRHIYATSQREQFSTDMTEPRIENVLFAGWQLIGKSADDALYPSRGYSWSTDLRAGGDAALDATPFARLHVTGNLVRSVGERLRMLLRTELGALRADEFERLVPSQRFYAGGDDSVRGYRYQSLGPRDENGANVGGRYLFRFSAEMEVKIVEKYGAAVFFDAGDASNDPKPDLKRGVGIGMRWLSPVGIVGIDIAHPLDDPDRSYRLHLRIGSDL